MAQHLETGKQGEDLAAQHLRRQLYDILERNFRHQHAEIDLIATKDNVLVFVEVKTRSNTSHGDPEVFVSWTKVRLLKRAAEQYIFAKDWPFDVRFDIVAVTFRNGATQVRHLEDAFS